ncbi:murein biosynthesis integral membrane protein MurJ [Nannocystis bainbridge]|uniref:Probable lipid II flippase MurJ n=1 Tax=Nannocystis bainbridge TaxID=2995303 RepID=A0ABT5E1Y4_9BACT|nr:murein biosynthesis integral membrane protein MurJ [Nannocystis bainbridge]MDC0719887.1 murein biosynthesis integral membrane protein MurJ [Nannocystis bainbridge]
MPSALQSSGSISAAVAASRVLGLVRMSLQSRLIGAGALADTFSVAFRIPNLLRDLLAEGALSSAFVPTFTAALVQEDRERAYQLANLALAGILLVTGALTLLGVVFAGPLVAAITSGWSAEKIAETAALTRIMMPILAFVSVGAVWGGILNAQRNFLPFALAPVLFNLVSIAAGLGMWLAGLGGPAAVMAWSVGTLVASVAQAAVLLPYLRRLGYRARPQLRGLLQHPGVRRIVSLMLPAIVGVAAVQLNVFVNTRFAASLGDGAVAQIEYAFRIFFLPIGVFGVALATVTATQVSEEAARGDRSRLIARTGEGLSAAWLLTSASTVGLILLAHPIVALIYEGGRFSPAESAAVALILQAYAIGLAPYSMVKIVAPAFYSIDRPRVPLIASVASVAVNIGFNAATYERLGAPGLALGTSLGAVVNLSLLRAFYRHEIGGLARPGRWREVGVLAAANAGLAVVVWAAWAGAAHLLAGPLAALPRPLRALLGAGALGLVVALGFVAFAAIVRAGRYPGGVQLWGMPAGLVRRLRRRRVQQQG